MDDDNGDKEDKIGIIPEFAEDVDPMTNPKEEDRRLCIISGDSSFVSSPPIVSEHLEGLVVLES